MPDSDFSEHPSVQAIDAAIEALTFLREGGAKMVPVDAAVWQAFVNPPAQRAAQAMPQVPEPHRAERVAYVGESDTPVERSAALSALRAEIAACQGCPYATAEARLAGRGEPWGVRVAVVNGASLLGDDLTAQGSRLEGEAGVLLEKMFAAIGLTAADLYITPALKCPVAGRPEAAALRTCSHLLQKELRVVAPQAIVALGPVAAKALFGQGVAATGRVGQWNLFAGRIPTVALHHPMRLLLLDPALAVPLKRENWAALQALRERLMRSAASPS